MLLYFLLLLTTLCRSGTRRRDLLWENLALRQQHAVDQRQTHRPPLRLRQVQGLFRQLAQENPRWGAPRLVGELQALGFDVSVRTVRRYRHAARNPPRSTGARSFAIMLPASGRQISSPSRP